MVIPHRVSEKIIPEDNNINHTIPATSSNYLSVYSLKNSFEAKLVEKIQHQTET